MHHKPISNTFKNLESAFAGESMAHIKYTYFAQIARAEGDEDTAAIFEATAAQEIMHAISHLELLHPRQTLTTATVLQMAIDGETYEYTSMYPGFMTDAEAEGNVVAMQELHGQIEESQEHAKIFHDTLVQAQKKFAALTNVEKRHAAKYTERLKSITSH